MKAQKLLPVQSDRPAAGPACPRRRSSTARQPAPHLEPAVAGQRLGDHHAQRAVGVVHLGVGRGVGVPRQVGEGGGDGAGDYHQRRWRRCRRQEALGAPMRDAIDFGSARSSPAAPSGLAKSRLRAEPCGPAAGASPRLTSTGTPPALAVDIARTPVATALLRREAKLAIGLGERGARRLAEGRAAIEGGPLIAAGAIEPTCRRARVVACLPSLLWCRESRREARSSAKVICSSQPRRFVTRCPARPADRPCPLAGATSDTRQPCQTTQQRPQTLMATPPRPAALPGAPSAAAREAAAGERAALEELGRAFSRQDAGLTGSQMLIAARLRSAAVLPVLSSCGNPSRLPPAAHPALPLRTPPPLSSVLQPAVGAAVLLRGQLRALPRHAHRLCLAPVLRLHRVQRR